MRCLAFADDVNGLMPVDLRCEYGRDSMGVDVPQPRLSWKLTSERNGARQSAWQVLVASSPEELGRNQGDLWDSGKVVSDEQFGIAYQGRPLQSLRLVFWKVRVWDEAGKASSWSRPGRLTMGILDPEEWKAHWIGASNDAPTLRLRREFAVRPGIKRVIAAVCGLGHYELTINGRGSGQDLLAPGWTRYDRTCLYDVHDLTPLIREGNNAMGLELGNGMYRVTGGRYVKFKGSFGPLVARVQVQLEYLDGTREWVITDDQWRTTPGPITFSCVYGGEDYDARLEQAGWNRAGFADSDWTPARIMEGPGGEMRGYTRSTNPMRAIETLTPVSRSVLTNGATVFDLGQNASMMPRIRVSGPAGATVRIIPAELLKADGSVDRGSVSLGQPGWWQYTLAGTRKKSWFPKFFYHGARYLQVELRPAEPGGELPKLESIEGVVVHSDVEPVGEFECSNPLFNRIRSLVRWAQRSNFASVLTDCPHRERLGWLEQYHLNGPSVRYEFALDRMFRKGMGDMADAQLENGCVPSIAPEYTIFGEGPDDLSNPFRNSPEWGSAFVLVPWQQYLFTGDLELLRQHFPAMRRYVAFMAGAATNDIVDFGLGDWFDVGPKSPGLSQLTPRALTATAFYFRNHQILAEAARLLGKPDDAAFHRREAERIRAAFDREFFHQETRTYSTGSQCANAIPLAMGMVDPAHRDAVLNALVTDIRNRTNSVTAGDVGYRYVLRALAEGGRSDVIFDMNNQSERPGYGYQLRHGATSLTESWTAERAASQNHFMLGQIMEWFYHDLAGIGWDPSAPGFRQVRISPQPVGDLEWVRARYESVRGPIHSSWRRDGDRFTLEIVVPPNCTATVHVPGRRQRVSGSDRGVVKMEEGTFQVPSGRHRFESRLR